MPDSPTAAAPRMPVERNRGALQFHLAGRLVQPSLNRIRVEGVDVQVEPKIMQVLVRLVERAGDVVPKEELIERVWEGIFVTDDVLVRAVGELRRILEGEGGATRVIETIRKRGYRLVAPVVFDMPREVQAVTVSSARPQRGTMLWLAVVAGALAAWWAWRAATPPLRPRFTPLTSLMGNEYDPALSPDGTRVVFAWDGGADGPTSLHLKMLGSETALRLTEGPFHDRAPAWSPDGSRIAFIRDRTDACDVMIVSALGGASRVLAPCANADHPRVTWSPDGKWLVQAGPGAPAGRSARLRLLALDTLEVREVGEDAPADMVDTSPAFSPDGGAIAFIRQLTDSVGDLYRVPPGGGPTTRLTFDNADIMGFAWLDGGRRLVFSSNRAGMYSLWSISAGGGEPELLGGGGRKIKHPSAPRDGSAVSYEAWNYDMNLFQLALPSGAGDPVGEDLRTQGGHGGATQHPAGGERVAPASDEWTFEPRYSPDGTKIAFASTRSGTYEIWVCGASGLDPMRLTSFDGPYVGIPRWSPDGQRLAFVARPQGRADVYVVDLAGGLPRRVTARALDEVAPSWSADGAWIYYGSRHEGEWQVYRTRVADGGERRVTAQGGYAALESPDGRWLYFTRIDHAGLWRMPVEGGAEALVTSDLRPEDWASWGVLERAVYWLIPPVGDAAPTVAMLREGEPNAAVLAWVPEMAWPGLDLSRDGRRLLYSRLDRHESNLVLMTLRPRS